MKSIGSLLGGGGGDAKLNCNGCWAACTSSEYSCATACGHLYCLSCCQTILESDDPTCPICTQIVHKSSVKAVHVLSSASDLALVVAGQTPRVALEVAHAGIDFFNKQQALYADYAAQQGQRKIARTQDQCRKKLQEVHQGYLNAKRKFEEVLGQKHALAQDNKELQDKYNQKAMQDKKMKEAFALIQAENEQLRRQVVALQGGGGGGGMGMGALGGGQPGRGGMGLPSGGGGGGGRASRAGMMGLDDEGLGRRPGSSAGMRAQQGSPRDPSPLALMRMAPGGSGGGGGMDAYGFNTPANQPVPLRPLQHSGGLLGCGGVAAGRHMSGGVGLGGPQQALGLGGMAMGGLSGRMSQNDKRASLGMPGGGGGGGYMSWGPSTSL